MRVTIDNSVIVPVKSNVHGSLRFESNICKEYWNDINDIVDLTWGEILSIRQQARAFFENNWIVLEDTEEYTAKQMYEALGVSKYYPDCDKVRCMDDIFTLKQKELVAYLEQVSDAAKENIIMYIKSLIKNSDKRVDSKSKMETLSKALNCEFEV